jgi:hypothetical protein
VHELDDSILDPDICGQEDTGAAVPSQLRRGLIASPGTDFSMSLPGEPQRDHRMPL